MMKTGGLIPVITAAFLSVLTKNWQFLVKSTFVSRSFSIGTKKLNKSSHVV